MRFDNILGVDPGYGGHPCAFVLVRVLAADFMLRNGVVCDPVTAEPVDVPDTMTAAEYAMPEFEVTDVQRRRGISFAQVAREAAAIRDDLGGDLVVACDATGLGVGAVEALRHQGLHAVAVVLTSGQNVTGGRLKMNVPVATVFSTTYKALAANRLRITADGGHTLAEELMAMSAQTTPTGHTRFEVGGGTDGHGDCAFALGIALVVAERKGRHQQIAMAAARHGQPRERPRGSGRRATNSARDRIRQLREERETHYRDAYNRMWDPLHLEPEGPVLPTHLGTGERD